MHSPSKQNQSLRASLVRVLSTICVLVMVSCAGPGLYSESRVTFGDWFELPMGWSRLGLVERWINEEGAGASAEKRLEATLDLAEGRVELASRDRRSAAPDVISNRLELATLGFRNVLGDRDAKPDQRGRAEDGLAAAGLLGANLDLRSADRGGVDFSDLGVDVRPRSTWRAKPADRGNMRASSTWNILTVHHTAMSARHLYGGSSAASADELRRIQKVHIQTEHWADIGYHFLIDPSGRVFEGRELRWQGAHAGQHPVTKVNNNPRNIGICLLGNFDIERPSQAALASLTGLLESLRRKHSIPRSSVFGHKHFKNTACPGSNLATWLSRYKAGLAMASSSPSRSTWGAQPSASSLVGSPTISSGSPARARWGSATVR